MKYRPPPVPNRCPGNDVFLALPFPSTRVSFYHLGASPRAQMWSSHWPANRRAGDRRWRVRHGRVPHAPGKRRPAHCFMSPSHRAQAVSMALPVSARGASDVPWYRRPLVASWGLVVSVRMPSWRAPATSRRHGTGTL